MCVSAVDVLILPIKYLKLNIESRIGSRIGSLGNIIFDILEPPAVQKYSICWLFLVLCHKLYLCICEFVFVHLTVRNISFDVLGP